MINKVPLEQLHTRLIFFVRVKTADWRTSSKEHANTSFDCISNMNVKWQDSFPIANHSRPFRSTHNTFLKLIVLLRTCGQKQKTSSQSNLGQCPHKMQRRIVLSPIISDELLHPTPPSVAQHQYHSPPKWLNQCLVSGNNLGSAHITMFYIILIAWTGDLTLNLETGLRSHSTIHIVAIQFLNYTTVKTVEFTRYKATTFLMNTTQLLVPVKR